MDRGFGSKLYEDYRNLVTLHFPLLLEHDLSDRIAV